mmetsp:Transcript_16340/g.48682  ORF Transcript_16340/g.48682 Transcript_16340/m.48682 type:complete len:208 (+) Transcript_16340:3098-3721(+)
MPSGWQLAQCQSTTLASSPHEYTCRESWLNFTHVMADRLCAIHVLISWWCTMSHTASSPRKLPDTSSLPLGLKSMQRTPPASLTSSVTVSSGGAYMMSCLWYTPARVVAVPDRNRLLLPGWCSYVRMSYMATRMAGSYSASPLWTTNVREASVELRKKRCAPLMKSAHESGSAAPCSASGHTNACRLHVDTTVMSLRSCAEPLAPWK